MEAIDILINIRKIVRSVNLESKRIQKNYGISIPQLLTLMHLKSRNEYQSTHKELQSFLQLNSSTVTGIVNRLERKGLIARLPKKDDRRMTNIALTSNGFELLNKAPDLLQDKLLNNLKGLSPSAIDEINSALVKLIDALEIDQLDASPMIMLNDPLES